MARVAEFHVKAIVCGLHHVDIVEVAGDGQFDHHIGDRCINPRARGIVMGVEKRIQRRIVAAKDEVEVQRALEKWEAPIRRRLGSQVTFLLRRQRDRLVLQFAHLDVLLPPRSVSDSRESILTNLTRTLCAGLVMLTGVAVPPVSFSALVEQQRGRDFIAAQYEPVIFALHVAAEAAGSLRAQNPSEQTHHDHPILTGVTAHSRAEAFWGRVT